MRLSLRGPSENIQCETSSAFRGLPGLVRSAFPNIYELPRYHPVTWGCVPRKCGAKRFPAERGWKPAGRGKKARKSNDSKILQCVCCCLRICITVWNLYEGKHYILRLQNSLSAYQIITSCTKGIRVFHENMLLMKSSGSTRSTSIWGLLWRIPKGFLILISFSVLTCFTF